VLVLAGCGEGGSTSPAAPTAPTAAPAQVTITIAPNPIVTTEGRSETSRQLAWQTVLTASAGAGVTVNYLNVTLRDAATGALAEPEGIESLSAEDIAAVAGSNRLTAPGTLVVPLTLTFDNDTNGGRLEIAAQLTDVNGNVLGASVTAPVE
jgi:hypothetical protein